MVDILDEQQSWLPVYFPLFQAGVEVAKGDVLEGSVSRYLSENSLNPDYLVQGRLRRQNGDVVSFHYHAYHFKRLYKSSPFYARLFADERLPVRPRLWQCTANLPGRPSAGLYDPCAFCGVGTPSIDPQR